MWIKNCVYHLYFSISSYSFHLNFYSIKIVTQTETNLKSLYSSCHHWDKAHNKRKLCKERMPWAIFRSLVHYCMKGVSQESSSWHRVRQQRAYVRTLLSFYFFILTFSFQVGHQFMKECHPS